MGSWVRTDPEVGSLSTSFFSHRRLAHPFRGDAPAPPALERQQIVVMRALAQAAGEAVSYAHLRDAGVEFPASVVSELELAGVQVERCYEHADGARMVVGVRLAPAHALAFTADAPAPALAERVPTVEPVPAPAALEPPPAWRRALSDRAYLRWLVSWAAVAALAAVVLLAIIGLAGGNGPGARAGAAHARRVASRAPARTSRLTAAVSGSAHAPASTPAPTAQSRPTAQSMPTPTPKSTPTPTAKSTPTRQASATNPAAHTPVSPALAAQLEAQGHELVQSGEYDAAIAVLKKALAATGESLAGCVQPSSETCLTYAYALYDLGRALRLNGPAAQAVGVLEHRLQIENQRPVVAEELASARRQLG